MQEVARMIGAYRLQNTADSHRLICIFEWGVVTNLFFQKNSKRSGISKHGVNYHVQLMLIKRSYLLLMSSSFFKTQKSVRQHISIREMQIALFRR